jgi:hypothetical protein
MVSGMPSGNTSPSCTKARSPVSSKREASNSTNRPRSDPDCQATCARSESVPLCVSRTASKLSLAVAVNRWAVPNAANRSGRPVGSAAAVPPLPPRRVDLAGAPASAACSMDGVARAAALQAAARRWPRRGPRSSLR